MLLMHKHTTLISTIMALLAVVVIAVLVVIDGGNASLSSDHIDTLSYSVAGFVSPLVSYIAGGEVVVFIYGGFSAVAALLYLIVPQTWQWQEKGPIVDKEVRLMTVMALCGGSRAYD